MWEFDAASRVLGSERIACVEVDELGKPYVRVDGADRPPSVDVEHFIPTHQDIDRDEFSVLCTLRKWVADRVPVYKSGLRKRQLFVQFDRVFAKLTWMSLACAPILTLAGIVWFCVSVISCVLT